MEYQFIRQEPCREKVIFVLTLDRKKLKERVLIGTEDEVRSRLEGNEGQSWLAIPQIHWEPC